MFPRTPRYDIFPCAVDIQSIASFHVETVCLLSKLKSTQHIEVEINMDELDLTDAEKKATYQEIKDYVQEHSAYRIVPCGDGCINVTRKRRIR